MILRSAFWLAVGFALVAPHGTDFGATAAAVKDQALAAGTDAVTGIVVSEVLGKAAGMAAAGRPLPAFLPGVHAAGHASTAAIVRPAGDASAGAIVIPRPRPAALG